MTTRQSFLIGLIPAALLAAFLIGRGTAPAGTTATPQAADNVASLAEPAPAQPQTAPPLDASTGAQAGTQPPVATGPMAGMTPPGDAAPDAPLSPTPDMDAKIAQAEKSGSKKAISDAYTERGTAHMYDEKAGRKVKYRAALEDFRKALAADPKNQDAKAAKDTIESIYKSLGRPIPQ